MKAATILLLSLAVSAADICVRGRYFVYAKGHAKVKVHSQDVVKGLHVKLVLLPYPYRE